MSEPTRCGYVALLGAPNAGKSTLMNRIVGAKLSIVSPKVQTTRSRVLGILIEDCSQVVFVDTPGIFEPRKRLERAMVAAAWAGAQDADKIVLLVDASRTLDENTGRIVEGLKRDKKQAVLALNKIDLISPEKLLGLTAELSREGIFERVFMISGLTGSGVDDLREYLAVNMPPSPWLFPEDQLSDMPQRLLASEVTREQMFLQLHDELPYASTVETESWEEKQDGSARITQVVYVRRESQKAIVLGQGGRQIKRIGARARQELEHLLERRVHLFLFVKVRDDWPEDRERYEAMGLEFDPKNSDV